MSPVGLIYLVASFVILAFLCDYVNRTLLGIRYSWICASKFDVTRQSAMVYM